MGPEEARGDGALRQAQLPDGRTLTVRAARPGDIEGLRRLFAELPLADRHRRFFSAYRPTLRFLERLVGVTDHDGAQLVAVVSGGDDERIVAEAGYRMLPDGDGELGITVAEEWRGWLGPFLLDALLEVAAGNGVPNLEAEVLVANRQMLALVRARGYALMGREDPSTLRVLVATQGHVPRWPPVGDEPRVLVEAPGGEWPEAAAARAAGLRVVACPGPTGRRRPCPALAGEQCPLAAEADAVVVARPRDDDAWRALPGAHREAHPGVPVCIDLGPEGSPRDPGEHRAAVVGLVQRTAEEHATRRAPDGETDPAGGPG